jgi:hypothetical protein
LIESRVLRKIFWRRRDEVTREWRRQHNEELYDFFSPNIIWVTISTRMRWAGHVARMGEKRDAFRDFMGRPEGKRSFGKLRRRWENNIKIDVQEVGCGGVDWLGLAEDGDRCWALVNERMDLGFHKMWGICD